MKLKCSYLISMDSLTVRCTTIGTYNQSSHNRLKSMRQGMAISPFTRLHAALIYIGLSQVMTTDSVIEC